LNETSVYKLFGQAEMPGSSMIVCWHEDGGCIGNEVAKYLTGALSMSIFAEIDPAEFFPMSGVIVENDVAKFPECRFYVSYPDNLVLLESAVPRAEWFKFISTILEIAEKNCKTSRIVTVGSMISMTPHTIPRSLLASMNNPESREYLKNYNVDLNLDYETPAGQRPTMSTYLVWEALRQNIMGISLWVPVPFYMVSVKDWAACSRVIKFFNNRFNLNLETANLDMQAERQNKAIADFLERNSEIGEIMRKYISNTGITEAESSKLAGAIEEHLGHGDCY